MSPQILTSLAVVGVAGAALALQAQVNAALGQTLGSTVAAATVNFGLGFVVLLVLTLLLGHGEALMGVKTAPTILLSGGALGAFYVSSVLWGIPMLGALSAFAILILGQMLTALALDATGLFGLATTPITWPRIAAALMVAGGVVLSRV